MYMFCKTDSAEKYTLFYPKSHFHARTTPLIPNALRIGRLRLSSTPPSSKPSAMPPTRPLPTQRTATGIPSSSATKDRRPISAIGVIQKSAAVREETTDAAIVPANDLRWAKGGEGSGGVKAPKRRPKTEAAVSAQERLPKDSHQYILQNFGLTYIMMETQAMSSGKN